MMYNVMYLWLTITIMKTNKKHQFCHGGGGAKENVEDMRVLNKEV